jgi:hypothetical protein
MAAIKVTEQDERECGDEVSRLGVELQAARLKARLSALIGNRQEWIERLDAMLSLAPMDGGGIDRSSQPYWKASKQEVR